MNQSGLLLRAEQGDPQAQYELALLFANPDNEEIDLDKAFYWLLKSANQGVADAQYHLAAFYENIKADLSSAFKWYKAAAEQGHVEAQSNLGYVYENGLGVKVDFVEAVKWHKKAAEQGCAVAQNNLARCFEHGIGVTADLSEAIRWYERAAEQGSPLQGIQNDLGLFYMTGEGVPVDIEKAVYWWSRAVEDKETPAFANLGRCYLSGLGVNKDVAKALKLFSIAIRNGLNDINSTLYENINLEELCSLANAGNAQAEYFLSQCYMNGNCCERDEAKAIQLLCSSAEKDEPLAMAILGCIYAEGKLVTQDLFRAEKLFMRALDLGFETAIKFVDDTRKLMHFHVPYYLVKITDKKWADKFMAGEVFMQSISHYAPMEEWIYNKKVDPSTQNAFRGDNMEGFAISYGDVSHFGLFSKTDILPDSFGLIDACMLREKIFCMYAYEYDEAQQCFIKPDSQLIDFGDTAVIVTDTSEFLKRIFDAVQKRFSNIDFYMAYRRVEYDIDTSADNDYNEFHKTIDYLWQKEFRIALDLSEGKIDKKTLENATNDSLCQYLDACRECGFKKFVSKPLTEEIMHKKIETMDFEALFEIDENPDSLSDSLTLDIGNIEHICISMPTSQFVNLQSMDVFTNLKINKPSIVDSFVPERQPRPTFFRAVTHFSKEKMDRIIWREKWHKGGKID